LHSLRKLFFYIIPIFLLSIILVNSFLSNSIPIKWKDKLSYYQNLQDPVNELNILNYLKKIEVSNHIYHFTFLDTYYQNYRILQNKHPEILVPDSVLIDYYIQFIHSDISKFIKIGQISLSQIYFYKNDFEKAFSILQFIPSNTPYLNYLYGNYLFYYDLNKSEEYLKKEIKLFPENKLAYQKLANLYLHYNMLNSLQNFEYKYGFQNLSYHQKKSIYYTLKKWDKYLLLFVERFFLRFDFFSFSGAFLILCLWLSYIFFINKTLFYKFKWWFPTLVLGVIFAYFTTLLSDILQYDFGFKLGDGLINDWWYCLLGVGLLEELIKFLPLLLLIIWKHKKFQIIDYMLLACIAALGFAMAENLIYFENGGIKTMQARALTATVLHMFTSAFFAYGLIRSIFLKPKYPFLLASSYFVIAFIIHGLYDFWLLYNPYEFLSIITFIGILIAMQFFVVFINNCINNSPNFNNTYLQSNPKIYNLILFGISAIFLSEYVMVSFLFGIEEGNNELQKDFYSGLFLLLFLSKNMSRFDWIPNYWMRFKIWDWDLIWSISQYHNIFKNFNFIVGKVVSVKMDNTHEDIVGKVVLRELISWEKNWYLIHLNSPITINWSPCNFIFIRSLQPETPILQGDKVLVLFVNDLDKLSEKNKNRSDYPLQFKGTVSNIEK
jgi:RsiW-degrading membrane proteinase PrsW (M82 family)